VIDCAIAGAFGIFGFILKRLDLPIVPIILGMVLGGIMETKLRTSMMRVDTPLDFISRPIAFIVFVIILLVIGSQLLSLWRDRKKR
jgi:putative tricarboxylic transport membrane protein